jgi:hypothetical protein
VQTRAPYGYGTGHPGPLSVQGPAEPGRQESKELLLLLLGEGIYSDLDFGQGGHAVTDTTVAARPTRAGLASVRTLRGRTDLASSPESPCSGGHLQQAFRNRYPQFQAQLLGKASATDPTASDLVANDTRPKSLARLAQSSYIGPMRLPERTKVDPDIMMSKPCVRDTRIPL